jgi:hypothetical protein
MTRRFRAPTADRAVLADPPFQQLPALVERNRRLLNRSDVRIGGLPLSELRRQARAEIIGDTSDSPLLITGHQPELSHPGVWVKNFALNGLAKKLGGVPLHLIADHDTMKLASLTFPTWDEWTPQSVRVESAAFDEFDTEQPWETRGVKRPERWAEFVTRVADAAKGWGYEPILTSPLAGEVGTRSVPGGGYSEPPPSRSGRSAPRTDLPPAGRGEEGRTTSAEHPPPHTSPRRGEVGDGVSRRREGGTDTWATRFTALRRHHEQRWGCQNHEIFVSALSRTDVFRRFVRHIAADADRFRHVYNASVQHYRRTHGIRSRSHPVPDLAAGELPFWVVEGPRRRAATTTDAASDTGASLRPRALTLTLFARLCLGDLFIHGIGGGKYDEVTDALIRDYFGVEPPAYQVLSATLHLPLKHFPATTADVHRLHRQRRDLDWNPTGFIDPREATELKRRKAELVATEPTSRPARRAWYRELQQVTLAMRPFVDYWARDVDRKLERARAEVSANALLMRRDYSWVLYPEDVLRPFLQQFL